MRRSSSLPKDVEGSKEEHGHLQSLSSPILSKINDGFVCFKDALTGKAKAKYTAFKIVEGAEESAIYVGWEQDVSRLSLVCKAISKTGWEQMRGEKLIAPGWLSGLANEAKVEAFAYKELVQFIVPALGAKSLKDVITDITGDTPPRRIATVGFCVGGSVATLLATWAAVNWPTADVRCITFGAPAVGNAAFVSAFRWLVSLSYRVMFRRDPIPEESTKLSPHKLKHVHGAVYISNESMQPGTQPKTQVAKADPNDHHPDAYSGALDTTCRKTISRERSSGGACRAQFDVKCMLKCPSKRREAAAKEAAAKEAAASLTPADSASSDQDAQHEATSDGFAEVNDEGELTEASSNGVRAFVRAGLGSLASDSASMTKAAVASAAAALSRISLRRQSSKSDQENPGQEYVAQHTDRWTGKSSQAKEEEVGPASKQFHAVMKNAGLEGAHESDAPMPEMLGVSAGSAPVPTPTPTPGATTEQVKGCQATAAEACKQFHAVMKNAGLEAEDEEMVSIPQLLGCSADSAPTRTDTQPDTQAASPAPVTPDQAKGQEASHHSACKQFHAVMKSAGLEAEDEEMVPIPELLGIPQQPAATQASAAAPPGHSVSAPQKPLDLQSAISISSRRQDGVDPQNAISIPSKRQEGGEQQAAHGGLESQNAISISSSRQESGEQRCGGSLDLPAAEASQVMDALEHPSIIDGAALEELRAAEERQAADGPKSYSRAFSMLERDSTGVSKDDLSNLQKVLVLGKISQAAVMAASAYRDQATFQRQTGITNSRLIHDKDHHDTKVHVGWLEGGTAVFAFRGTATRQDGLQDVKIFSRNIDYLQELYPGVKAHLGFLQQFAAVCHPDRPELNMAAVLKELSGGQTPNRVICCGHSLGGALATLGAAWAALEYPDADVRSITFGSPRVANKVFGKAFNALVGTSLRLVHGFDPVPALPPSMMYKHVPGVIHIRRQELLLQRRPWHTMFRTTISDHSMLKYSHGVYRHMPGGLESLPYFFIQRPVNKICDTMCPKKAKQRRLKAAQEDPISNDALKVTQQEDKSRAQPEQFRAGPWWACFGNDQPDADALPSALAKSPLQEAQSHHTQPQAVA